MVLWPPYQSALVNHLFVHTQSLHPVQPWHTFGKPYKMNNLNFFSVLIQPGTPSNLFFPLLPKSTSEEGPLRSRPGARLKIPLPSTVRSANPRYERRTSSALLMRLRRITSQNPSFRSWAESNGRHFAAEAESPLLYLGSSPGNLLNAATWPAPRRSKAVKTPNLLKNP